MDAYQIPLVAGDHSRLLLFTVRDRFLPAPGHIWNPYDPKTWAPHNLTRVVGIRVPTQPLDRRKPAFPMTAAKQEPYESGVVSLIWPPHLFDKPGIYEAEMSLEYSGGDIETIYKRLRFIVKDRLR